MSDLSKNAIDSIELGIEDYQSNDLRRPISAVRNFYAGILLLCKQCLVEAAPNAEPMEILASKFTPCPDEEGGVYYKPSTATIDFGELKERFKKFDLDWPKGNIANLQKLRNQLEHYHSSSPKEVIQQAIAECFPFVEGLFGILRKDPVAELGKTWAVMLGEKKFFETKKAQCNESFSSMSWRRNLANYEYIKCLSCSSSLIYQKDPQNSDPALFDGKCLACGTQFSAEETVQIIVEAEYGDSSYLSYKDGGSSEIHDCPECCNSTYVLIDDINECYFCGFVVDGECDRCGVDLTVENQSVNTSSLCDYCDCVVDK